MSKTKEKILNTSLQLKSEHLDAIHFVNRFVAICRDIHQTPKQFEKSMHELYKRRKIMVFNTLLTTFVTIKLNYE